MAVVRYFSVSGEGTQSGTTQDNSAPLFSGGAWSTVLTGYDFASAGLIAMIKPGTYTITAALTHSVFSSNPPTSPANPLLLVACDSSGNELAAPDPDWNADIPFTDTGMPVLATTTNIYTLDAVATPIAVHVRNISFTASGRNGTMVRMNILSTMDWCSLHQSSNGSSTVAFLGQRITNSFVRCSGTSYSAGITWTSATPMFIANVRIQGNPSASAGSGILNPGGSLTFNASRICAFNHPSNGIDLDNGTTSTTEGYMIRSSVVALNGKSGILLPDVASPVAAAQISECAITGNGTSSGTWYGIDGQTDANAQVVLWNNRMRDNDTGNLNNVGSEATSSSLYTTDSDDATEYYDAVTTFDFRIKSGLAWGGRNIGISEIPAAASGGMVRHPGMSGGMNG